MYMIHDPWAKWRQWSHCDGGGSGGGCFTSWYHNLSCVGKKEEAVLLTDQHYHYLQINSQRKVKRLQSSQSGQFREWMISFWEIVHRFWLNDLFWVRTVHFWPLGTYLDVFKFAIPITIFQKRVESFSCKSLILKFSYHRWLACDSATVCHSVTHSVRGISCHLILSQALRCNFAEEENRWKVRSEVSSADWLHSSV